MPTQLRFLACAISRPNCKPDLTAAARLFRTSGTPTGRFVGGCLSPSLSVRHLSCFGSANLKSKSSIESSSCRSPGSLIRTTAMSTMPSTGGHSKACCNVPPVISSGYVPKGSYGQSGGMKSYVTGPENASRGIVSVFDIFGYFDQTVQGADILATSDDYSKYKVFMPDWFGDDACPIEWYPPDTEQKQKNLGNWFDKHGPQTVAAALPEYVKSVQAANPSIKSWGIIGYCWGGKVVTLVTSNQSNPFSIAAVAHPAMVDSADAEKISVPYALLASMDEPKDTVRDFEGKLSVPHHVETFDDQIHGWMAARGDLSNSRVREEYERGYKTVLDFFGKHWS